MKDRVFDPDRLADFIRVPACTRQESARSFMKLVDLLPEGPAAFHEFSRQGMSPAMF